MGELINITEKDGRQAVSARELHSFLESKQQFANWIQNRIEKYGLIENQDFVRFNNSIKTTGGRTTEYALTLDTAKELSMLEGNDKGKQARRYFIACEKKLTQLHQIPHSFADALRLAAEQQEAIEQRNRLLEEQRPKVLFADSVQASKTCILIGEMAKIIKQNGINIGQNRMFEWLRGKGYLIARFGTDYNMPTQKSMNLGLFEIKETAITHSDGHISVSKTVKVTGKGQLYFINKFLDKVELMQA